MRLYGIRHGEPCGMLASSEARGASQSGGRPARRLKVTIRNLPGCAVPLRLWQQLHFGSLA
jgi:hypothetical protein